MSDFVIENGVLKKYVGPGGDVVVPEGVTEIGSWAFGFCDGVTSVTIPEGIISIGPHAFCECIALTSVSLPGSVTGVGKGAFENCIKLKEVFAPQWSLAVLKELGLGTAAVNAFLKRREEYVDSDTVSEYIRLISAQRKKLLALVFEQDAAEIIRLLADAGKITSKNIDQDYLIPAKQCRAEKCIAELEALSNSIQGPSGQGARKKATAPELPAGSEFWDGKHFSLDGKKLLKYPEEPGRTRYEIPDGTTEIGKDAFYMTPLTEIILPKSVTTVRNGAFMAPRGGTIFVKLPKAFRLKDLPEKAFLGDSRYPNWAVYYVSAHNKALATPLCMDSASKGNRRMIYTGGPLDDLPTKTKKYAVEGFLYAEEHGLEDMNKWRGSYLDHIKRNEKTYLKLALGYDHLFHLMLNEGLLSETGVSSLLKAVETDQPDRKAALLDYQNKYFGAGKKETLTLSENDPEIKRITAMAERREKIKGQTGIKGLIFVSTGEFVNFGEYSEYTGAKDMGDLKAYIEQRGGFLRSAVSSKTDYLICNNPNSNSVKSKKARELGVPVITEEEFLRMANEKE